MMWGSIVKLLDEIVIAAIISMLGFICGKTYKKIRSFFYKRAMSFSIDLGSGIPAIIIFREKILLRSFSLSKTGKMSYLNLYNTKNIKRTDIHFGEEGFSLRMWFLYSIVQIVKI